MNMGEKPPYGSWEKTRFMKLNEEVNIQTGLEKYQNFEMRQLYKKMKIYMENLKNKFYQIQG